MYKNNFDYEPFQVNVPFLYPLKTWKKTGKATKQLNKTAKGNKRKLFSAIYSPVNFWKPEDIGRFYGV